jgi:hypothetical protein
VVQNFCLSPKSLFAVIQGCSHLLELGRESLSNFSKWHSARLSTLWGFPSARKIAKLYDHESGYAIPQCGPSGERDTAFHAFRQAAIGALVGKQQMLQYLSATPLPCRRLGQRFSTGSSDGILDFQPQAFKVGIHGISSVQWAVDHG